MKPLRPVRFHLPPPLALAIADGALLSFLWLSLHQVRFGVLPALTRGPLIVIPLLVALEWLLGSYTGLARQTLTVQNQFNRFVMAAALLLLTMVIGYRLTGLSLDATIGRGFLLPVLLSGGLSSALLRLLVGSQHVWQPQQRWLILANPVERQILAEELERGGCEIPAAVEWRPLLGGAPLPAMLPALLQLQGVAIGKADKIPHADARQLLLWQRQGLVLEPLVSWAESHLRRSPPGLVAQQGWVEQASSLQGLRTPQNLRLKRLLDLSLALPIALVIAPPLALLILGCDLAGRPLHSQRRQCLGLDGQIFEQWRLVGSARLERLGLAALPQLINVLRGEMSLVGPRPVTPQQQAQLEQLEPSFSLRLRCKPGMTGWGRISGPAPRDADAHCWELGRDLYYLRHGSAGMDVAVLLRAGLWLLWALISGGGRR